MLNISTDTTTVSKITGILVVADQYTLGITFSPWSLGYMVTKTGYTATQDATHEYCTEQKCLPSTININDETNTLAPVEVYYIKTTTICQMQRIPHGICVDLETTIAGKIPDNIQPPGQKRYETRIIEIGAVDWLNPTNTFGCLVNPIPSSIQISSVDDIFNWLTENHQKPTATLNFWSRVLVNRNSLLRTMFRTEESPLVWLNRTTRNRAIDFVHWHNHPEDGPVFHTEEVALGKLIGFGAGRDWLAHNGNSFDFKVLEGCALRTGLSIPPSIQKHDTLHLFRKHIPGHKSYSQPKLYSALFRQTYNAHVAIDDAKALSRLCQHVAGTPYKLSKVKLSKVNRIAKSMNLTFPKTDKQKMGTVETAVRKATTVVQKSKSLKKVRGIGPKSVAALVLLQVTTVPELRNKVKMHGTEWLRDNLPFGVSWKKVAREII
tara:strand:+ start:1429 stop:2733 length:1305 start_codon:yes stop_codon:yes gene_type:complete